MTSEGVSRGPSDLAAGGGRLRDFASWSTVASVSTITVILEPDADGSLHLPVPAEMKRGKIKVVATLTAVAGSAGSVDDEASNPTQAIASLRRIAARGGLHSMGDAAAWQREIRGDRVLPGRDS